MNSNEYIEVRMTFEPFSEEMAEIVEAEISDLPYDSFMTEDDCLKAYIQKDLYDARALKVVLSGLAFDVRFSADLMPQQNWNAAWENEFVPIIVDKAVTVRATRHTDEDVLLEMAACGLKCGRTRYTVRIDPKMAFGTGHHHTTYMMMQSLIANADSVKGKVVMDMGCGTGVLAILAAKMGAEKAYGIDIDAVAAQSAFDNARLNRVGRKVETHYGDASRLQAGSYDVLLANIHRNIIIGDMRTYAGSLRKGGLMLLSGFYDSDVADVRSAAEAEGLIFENSRSREGWSCLQFRKM